MQLSGVSKTSNSRTFGLGHVARELRNHTNSRLVFAGVGSLGIQLEGDIKVTLRHALPSVSHAHTRACPVRIEGASACRALPSSCFFAIANVIFPKYIIGDLSEFEPGLTNNLWIIYSH